MSVDKQVLYDGRWVDREHFVVFVYNSTGQKLVKSYKDFMDAITSGSWFATKDDVKKAQDTENNVVTIKHKRGKKCHNLQSQ